MTRVGLQLETEFLAATSPSVRGELPLFRALLTAFANLGGQAVGEEYHGAKRQVVFSAQRGAGRPTPRCELADLLLLTFPAGAAASARMTWMQAKVAGSALASSLGCRAPSSGRTSFRANLEQWDLLAHRPTLKGATSGFHPPPDLLSAATLPSAGSFGVFYPRGSSFDLAYFVGDCLSPLHNNNARGGTLLFTGRGCTRTIHGFDEAPFAPSLRVFGWAIEHGLVGTPVRDVLSAGDAAAAATRRSWWKSLLRELATDRPDSPLLAELSVAFESLGDPAALTPAARLARATVVVRYENADAQTTKGRPGA